MESRRQRPPALIDTLSVQPHLQGRKGPVMASIRRRAYWAHNIPNMLVIAFTLGCSPCARAATAGDAANVGKRIAPSDAAYPKLVLQRTIPTQTVFAWSRDDRFVIGIDNLVRSVTVWDAATGDIVNLVPFPAFDPKSNIEAWDARVDHNSGLTVKANIRDTDSSFCTALTMRLPPLGGGDWQVQTGEPMAPCIGTGLQGRVIASHNGQLRIDVGDYPFVIEDARGRPVRKLDKPEPTMAFGAALSPDGKRMALIFDVAQTPATAGQQRRSGIMVFDLAVWAVVSRVTVEGFHSTVTWLDDEKVLLPGDNSGGDRNSAQAGKPGVSRVIAASTGKAAGDLIPFRCYTQALGNGVIIGAGLGNCTALHGRGEQGLQRYDPATGWQALGPADASGTFIETLAATPDGKRLIVTTSSHLVRAIDTEDGTVIAETALPDGSTYPVIEFAADSKSVGLSRDGRFYRWEMAAAPFTALEGNAPPVEALARATVSSDGKSWYERFAEIADQPISAVSIAGGARESRLLFKNVVAEGAIPGSPLRWVVTNTDGIVLWRPRRDDAFASPEVLRTYLVNDRSFFTMAPDGRYDTDLGADTRDFRWVVSDAPLQSLGPQTFMRNFFEPRLGPRVMACTLTDSCASAFRPVARLADINRVLPTVRITGITKAATPGNVLVGLELRPGSRPDAPNGKLHSDGYDLRLFRNGSLVAQSPGGAPDALQFDLKRWRQENRVVVGKDGVARIRLPVRVSTSGAPVEFTAYAFNEDRVKSETARQLYRPPSVATSRRRIFVVAIGIDGYAEPRLRLNFAADDAALIGARLATLPDAENVHLLVLAGTGKPGSPDITRAALADVFGILGGSPRREALARLQARGIDASTLDAAGPDDVVLISFSGHGWADRQGNFYLLPTDARWPDATLAPDVASFVSTLEMSRFLRRIDAGEMAMIIDACHSAASVDAGGFRPGPMGDGGLGQLAFDKRMRILAATQADDIALESANLGQGLLTYALADEGITANGGMADENGDGAITLDEWLRYAVHRLPMLSQDSRIARRPGAPSGARGVDFLDGTAARRPVQEPSLFDFTGSASQLVLRRLRP